MRLVEVHVIQTVPPQAANRDDVGRPKTVVYGGVERTRWSSQAQKRAMRSLFRSMDLLPLEERAQRTRALRAAIAARLGWEEERVAEALRGLLEAIGLKEEDGGFAQYLLFLGESELDGIARLVRERGEELSALAQARASEGEEGKKGKRKAKGGELPKEVLEDLEDLFRFPSLEVALFGRMVADRRDLNVEGALAVAHAVGTTADPVEEDYFTALDDILQQAGMIESRGFSTATLYRYAVLNLDRLVGTVGKERALLGAEAVLKAFPFAVPAGGERAFAHFGEPEAVLVRVGEGMPRNLAKAFARPVDGPGHPAEESLKRLLGYWNRLDETYGALRVETRTGVSLFPVDGFPWAGSFPEAVGEALEGVRRVL